MGPMVSGIPQGAPSLKRVRTVVRKDKVTSQFKNMDYYNVTEGVGGVKGIIARFEDILDSEYHGSPGLGGLRRKESLEINILRETTHFSPAILGRSWGGEKCQGHQEVQGHGEWQEWLLHHQGQEQGEGGKSLA